MSAPRIYYSETLQINTEISLTDNAANHVAKVLRRQVGDELRIFNGDGCEYLAKIMAINKRDVAVKIETLIENNQESPVQIHLQQAVARAEKMDWVVQKATELGVATITPLITERSGVKLSAERWEKRLEHWRAIAISACEQCGRNRLPEIKPILTLTDLFEQRPIGRSFILAPTAISQLTDNLILTDPNIQVLIGPEGGFSPIEQKNAEERGYCALRLGPRILRTETAPIVALTVLQAYFGDLC